jgi:hypothetical protein
MGLLFTTEGTRRVLDTLNEAFNAANLAIIQSAATNSFGQLSDLGNMVNGRGWRPGHLASALKLMPYDQGNPGTHPNWVPQPAKGMVDKHRKRWAYFLRNVVDDGSAASDTFKALRNALADPILDKTFVRVTFSHVETDVAVSPNLVVFDAADASGKTVRHITLFTAAVPANQNSTDFEPKANGEPDPPASVPWEH